MQKLKRFGVGGIAAAGATALVLGLSSAPAMAVGTFDTNPPTISAPTSTYLPASTSSSGKDVPFKVTFSGPGAPYTYAWGDAKTSMVARNTKIKSSYVQKTFRLYPVTYNPSTPGTCSFTGKIYGYITTPGKYRMSVPVIQKNGGTAVATHSAKKDIVVRSSPTFSKARTSVMASGIAGRTWNVPVTAPYYQVGAKAAIYAKLKGQKSYHKVTTARTLANYTSGSSKTTLKLSGTYTKTGTRLYVKVTSAPYAPGYQTASAVITRR